MEHIDGSNRTQRIVRTGPSQLGCDCVAAKQSLASQLLPAHAYHQNWMRD